MANYDAPPFVRNYKSTEQQGGKCRTYTDFVGMLQGASAEDVGCWRACILISTPVLINASGRAYHCWRAVATAFFTC